MYPIQHKHKLILQNIRKLIYLDLKGDEYKNTTKFVLDQLRKIPWDAENEEFLLRCLLKVNKGKYSSIHLVASLVSGLATYHEVVGIKLVDGLLESIRVGLEENDFKKQQRQVMNVKFLGELYNYCVVESQVVFDTLYLFITFGHTEGQEESPLDPPSDCFRIRLVCTLLDSCGQYFDRGSSKKKLDKFLLYFQRYVLGKTKVPMDVEFMLSDTLEALRPNLIRCQTYEEASLEIDKMERAESSAVVYTPPTAPTPTILTATTPSTNQHPESESDSEDSQTSDRARDEEEEEDAQEVEEDEEEEEEEESESDGEDDVAFKRDAPRAAPAEDEEFEREYKKMMQESLESRRLEARQASRTEMFIPAHLLRSKPEEESSSTVPTEASKDSMQFRMLVKKGNKQTIKNIHVPLQSSFAINSKAKQNAEKEEQKELKRLVLEYEEREEEHPDDISNEGTPYDGANITDTTASRKSQQQQQQQQRRNQKKRIIMQTSSTRYR